MRAALVGAFGAVLVAGDLPPCWWWQIGSATAPVLAMDPPGVESPPGLLPRAQPSFPIRVLIDGWGIATSPVDWDAGAWTTAAAGAGAVALGIAVADAPVQRWSQRRTRGSDGDRAAQRIGRIGGPSGAIAMVGGFLAVGLVADDDRAQAVAADTGEAILLGSVLLTTGLKAAFGRERPREAGDDADRFQPFGSGRSLPSGHATQAFAMAGVLSAHYPEPWIAWSAHAIAAAVAATRVQQDAHYLSDVVLGAMIGAWVAHEVTARNQARRLGTASVALAIDLAGEAPALGLRLDW